MNVDSRRWHLRTDPALPGKVILRDRDAPYHTHIVDRADLPGDHQLGAMTERAFDRALHEAAYGSAT